VSLTILILVFLIAAIIPGYKAFALSMQNKTRGSTGDADFWYLIHRNVMVVIGNLVVVVPLLKRSWFLPAYSLMWALFSTGLACAVISVAMYPFLNPGWSSMLTFLASMASAASVLVMTQATAGKVDRVKIKSD
jgi:peptidoglycan/LPS O-acetylase OafA/YrhL